METLINKKIKKLLESSNFYPIGKFRTNLTRIRIKTPEANEIIRELKRNNLISVDKKYIYPTRMRYKKIVTS